ncbi:hypothetical protein [Streptomyces sp. NPDC059258]|uniref:hypothetical protein n=1 Tax=unclassified Streptomyces TaxID=2593676 RepID=UPI0036B61AC7
MTRLPTPTVVAQRQVHTDTHQLTVSTIRIAADCYETVVFDDSPDRRHKEMVIGGYVIGLSAMRASDRETGMDNHREALIALRDETPQPGGTR